MIEYKGEHKLLSTHSFDLIKSMEGHSILKMLKVLEWGKKIY